MITNCSSDSEALHGVDMAYSSQIAHSRRYPAASAESRPTMAREIASILLRNSLGSLHSDRARCSSCLRTPLIGEHMHTLDSGRLVLSLCPWKGRAEPVGPERVRAAG